MVKELSTASFSERGALFWQMDLYRHFQNQGPKPQPYATSTIVDGKWKLLMDSIGPAALYDLNLDHREIYNVLDDNPEIAEELTVKLNVFLESDRDSTGFTQKQ